MEKKDLYLSDEQLTQAYDKAGFVRPKQPKTAMVELDKAIVKASADYAVKKVIEIIENPFEGYIDVIENIRMAKSQGFERFREALKKLVEGS